MNSVVQIHQVITGIIADVQCISNHGSCDNPPLDQLTLELTTLGLNSKGAVVLVVPTYLLVCGAIPPSTLEGAAGRYRIWPTHDWEGTDHNRLPFWRFPAYPFLGSKVINLRMRGPTGLDCRWMSPRLASLTNKQWASLLPISASLLAVSLHCPGKSLELFSSWPAAWMRPYAC